MGEKGAKKLKSEFDGKNSPYYVFALSDLLTVLLVAIEDNRRLHTKFILTEIPHPPDDDGGGGDGDGSGGGGGDCGDGGGSGGKPAQKTPEQSPEPPSPELSDSFMLPLKQFASLLQPVRQRTTPSDEEITPQVIMGCRHGTSRTSKGQG
jgi:hypothetical protein